MPKLKIVQQRHIDTEHIAGIFSSLAAAGPLVSGVTGEKQE